MSNIVRMTLTNDSVDIYTDRIIIQPVNSDSFIFSGSVSDLISILVYHKDIDMANCIIRVHPYRFAVIPRSEERQLWKDKYGEKDDI
jgi:hypothetical protein